MISLFTDAECLFSHPARQQSVSVESAAQRGYSNEPTAEKLVDKQRE